MLPTLPMPATFGERHPALSMVSVLVALLLIGGLLGGAIGIVGVRAVTAGLEHINPAG